MTRRGDKLQFYDLFIHIIIIITSRRVAAT